MLIEKVRIKYMSQYKFLKKFYGTYINNKDVHDFDLSKKLLYLTMI